MIVSSISDIDDSELREMSFNDYLNHTIYKEPYKKFLEYDSQLKYENVEVEVVFGDKLSRIIEEYLNEVIAFYTNYSIYISNLVAREKKDFYYLRGNDYSEKYIFRSEDNTDEFSQKLNEAIKKIEDSLKPFIKLKK
jgi:hypothetical protein